MEDMKEVYIIICSSSDGAFHIEKKFGTRKEIQDYLADIISVDAKNDIGNYLNGTDGADELEYVGEGNGMYGYNNFYDYSINYYTYPVNDIPTEED